MRMLSAAELLTVWELGLERRPFERALILLEAACPESSPGDLAKLSIGTRDDALLKLREWVFGPQLSILAECPRCNQQLESALKVADLRSPTPGEKEEESALAVGDYQLRFRSPNSEDIAAFVTMEASATTNQLVRRCVVDATFDGKPVSSDQLPAEVVGTIADQMAQMDSGADLHIDLTCPACAFCWREPFDIVSFFWMEMDAWARRVMSDVHALALAYGWTERDILALSPLRRQFYLDLTNG